MTRSDVGARRAAARKALEAYLAGPKEAPFVMSERDGYCACDIAFPGLFSRLALARRYVLVRAACAALLPGCLQRWLLRRAGAKVGRRVCIAPRVSIDPFYTWLVEIGDDCVLGEGCRIFTHEYTADSMRIGPVRVGAGSVIGAYSTVRSGVTIGARATIGFCSFVNRDVPEGATVAGVPARVIREGGSPASAPARGGSDAWASSGTTSGTSRRSRRAASPCGRSSSRIT